MMFTRKKKTSEDFEMETMIWDLMFFLILPYLPHKFRFLNLKKNGHLVPQICVDHKQKNYRIKQIFICLLYDNMCGS